MSRSEAWENNSDTPDITIEINDSTTTMDDDSSVTEADEEQEEGLEEAFTFIDEYTEVIASGHWVSNECFVLINTRGQINYLIGGRIMKFGQANKK